MMQVFLFILESPTILITKFQKLKICGDSKKVVEIKSPKYIWVTSKRATKETKIQEHKTSFFLS